MSGCTQMSFEKGTIEEGQILCKMDYSQSSTNVYKLSEAEPGLDVATRNSLLAGGKFYKASKE
jgi:hypothetical protein